MIGSLAEKETPPNWKVYGDRTNRNLLGANRASLPVNVQRQVGWVPPTLSPVQYYIDASQDKVDFRTR